MRFGAKQRMPFGKAKAEQVPPMRMAMGRMPPPAMEDPDAEVEAEEQRHGKHGTAEEFAERLKAVLKRGGKR